jgi:hypothetical protein
MTSDLIYLAAGAKVPIATYAADHFLRDTLDLLSNSLDFLFGCLPAERWHSMPSLGSPIKQEAFRFWTQLGSSGNSGTPASRLSSQET